MRRRGTRLGRPRGFANVPRNRGLFEHSSLPASSRRTRLFTNKAAPLLANAVLQLTDMDFSFATPVPEGAKWVP